MGGGLGEGGGLQRTSHVMTTDGVCRYGRRPRRHGGAPGAATGRAGEGDVRARDGPGTGGGTRVTVRDTLGPEMMDVLCSARVRARAAGVVTKE